MILNEKFLRNEAKKITKLKNFSMILEEQKSNIEKDYDLFISHSFMDKELVEVLYKKFDDAGYNVYIDWKEEMLQDRNKVSYATAKILKQRMDNCLGLSYIATENITNSKWCPWELGYVDGKKGKVAILPILKNEEEKFNGQEYLGIYPYIVYAEMQNSMKYEFWVRDTENKNKYSILKDWLKTGKLDIH